MDAVEREAKVAGRDARRRGEVRNEQSEQISAGIRALPDELSPQALPKCELGRAIGYANNQGNALERFVADGEYRHPRAKRRGHDIVVGRDNLLHAGSPEGGARAAQRYSLINSCKLQGFDPFECLRDVIERVSTHPASRVAELRPRGWKLARAAAAH